LCGIQRDGRAAQCPGLQNDLRVPLARPLHSHTSEKQKLCVVLRTFEVLARVGIVLACAAVITLIILVHLKPLRDMYNRVAVAETWKSATLGETIVGIKTVKALALEPQRKALWDERIAETGKWRLAFGRLANWPQTLVNPFERLILSKPHHH
jgi:ATP-binding cassette, subfamily B, bacterial HlyB/CyaB